MKDKSPNNLIKLIRWVSTSFQKDNGKVCSKRITASVTTLLMAYVIVFDLSNSNSIAALGILSGLIAALLGIKDYFEMKNLKNEATPKISGGQSEGE